MITREEALKYHGDGRRGKIEVTPTKPCQTQRDLAMAYTPGVAEPCREIERDPSLAYEYTARANLVAVVSNGSAVLGLGKIGALAGKPVMEGKGVLFKRFADIDVFDIELDSADPEEIIRAVKLMEPTFGGINLEDIRAPECFEIEERLKQMMDIPVFHDDQHGTAIISGAGLINALQIAGKDIETVKVVFNGAGAAGIACAKFYIALGVKPENVLLCDSTGVIYKGRTEHMNKYKEAFAVETEARTLSKLLDSNAGGLWPPVVEEMKVEKGYEAAIGAALGDDLEASANTSAPAHWASTDASGDPALPPGVTPLSQLVQAPPALARRLAQIGVVLREEGPRLRGLLKPGQRLVSKDGDLWRWDGFTQGAEAPTAAHVEARPASQSLSSSIGIGRAYRNPCPSSQPSSPRRRGSIST